MIKIIDYNDNNHHSGMIISIEYLHNSGMIFYHDNHYENNYHDNIMIIW